MATLEGKAFAGAQAQAKLIGSAEWSPSAQGAEWKSMVSGEAGVAGTAGIGLEGKFHFGYKNGYIRCCCALQATFVVGGKGFWDFDLGIVEGLEFLGQLARCVDYHYIADIAEDLYESLGAYKFSLLVTPQTGMALGGLYVLKDIDKHAENAKKFVDHARSLYRQVDKFVDKAIQDNIYGVSKAKLKVVDAKLESLIIYDSSGNKNGWSKSWYENGTLKDSVLFSKGDKLKEHLFYENGKKMFSSTMRPDGYIVSSVSFDTKGKKNGEVKSGNGRVILPGRMEKLDTLVIRNGKVLDPEFEFFRNQ